MIRQHKKMILFTSILTLLPILIGLLLWNRLPDSVATHFGADNQPDGYSSKIFSVFGPPFLILLLHFICVIAANMIQRQIISAKKYSGLSCGFAHWFLYLFAALSMYTIWAIRFLSIFSVHCSLEFYTSFWVILFRK